MPFFFRLIELSGMGVVRNSVGVKQPSVPVKVSGTSLEEPAEIDQAMRYIMGAMA